MRSLWLLIGVLSLGGCRSGDEHKAPARKVVLPPPDAALPVTELRGRRLCSQLAPPAELARIAGVDDLVMAAGYSQAADGQLGCVYLWPASGTPMITIDVRVDCRPIRPSNDDLASYWSDAGRQGDELTRAPAAGVHQSFLDLSEPGCHLGVTTGFVETDHSAAFAELISGRLDRRAALALDSKSGE